MKISALIVVLIIVSGSCRFSGETDSSEYLSELQEWKKNRLERLKSESGWLNLAGLYWLEEGENSFGSDSSNALIFPSPAPAFAGKIIKLKKEVFLIPQSRDLIEISGDFSDTVRLQDDMTGEPTLMKYKNLAWYVIRRDTLLGIRLRDYQHPRISELKKIPSYPPDPKWRKTAMYIPFDEPDTITTPTIIGIDEKYIVPGKLRFIHDNEEIEILPFASGENFFIIIGDLTSLNETYSGGRFMYAEGPDRNNRVILDFNKAYNPPCAFTPWSTCAFPPPENRLKIRVEAGEKRVHSD